MTRAPSAVRVVHHRFEERARGRFGPVKMRRLDDYRLEPLRRGQRHQQRDHGAVAVAPQHRPLEAERLDDAERLDCRAVVEVALLPLERPRQAVARAIRDDDAMAAGERRRSGDRRDRSRSPSRRAGSGADGRCRARGSGCGPASRRARAATRGVRQTASAIKLQRVFNTEDTKDTEASWFVLCVPCVLGVEVHAANQLAPGIVFTVSSSEPQVSGSWHTSVVR